MVGVQFNKKVHHIKTMLPPSPRRSPFPAVALFSKPRILCPFLLSPLKDVLRCSGSRSHLTPYLAPVLLCVRGKGSVSIGGQGGVGRTLRWRCVAGILNSQAAREGKTAGMLEEVRLHFVTQASPQQHKESFWRYNVISLSQEFLSYYSIASDRRSSFVS